MASQEFGLPEEDLRERIEAARSGEAVAQEELFRLCEPVVIRYVASHAYPSTLRWMQRDELVAWILEEVLCSLEHLPEGPIAEALMVRIQRVAFERVRDGRRNHQKFIGDSALPASRGEAALPNASTGPVTRADDQELLKRLIEALPKQYSDVVDLHLREGLLFPQIGERLGITGDAAYRRYKSARELLIERVESRRGE